MKRFLRCAPLALLMLLAFASSVSAVWGAEQFSNFALTSLNATIGPSDTTLTVVSTANFPSTAPFRLTIQDSQASTPEIVMVTAISGNTYTVTRGIEGTTASGHSSGAAVAQFVTAGVISGILSEFPVGSTVGTTDTQTLTNKTMSGSNNTLTNIPAANLTGTAPNTAIPTPTTSALGGIIAQASATAHQVVQYINASGQQVLAQLGFSDLTGSASASQMPAFTGDTHTSAGATATTTDHVNGVAYPASPSTNTVPVVTGANQVTYETVPVSAGGAYVLDISIQLIVSSTYSSGNATANAAAINGAIILANTENINTVAITVPGVYYANQIVMYSNTNLELGQGVVLRKPPNTPASMIINEGALQGTPATDTNIQIIGQGEIDGNPANESGLTTRATNGTITANTFLYGIQGEVAMIGVNNFAFSLRNVYNTSGFGIQFIGTNALIQNVIANTALDFIHVNGPSSHILIDNVTGYSTDAFVALNAWDWHISSPTVGDITDVRVTKSAYYGSNLGGRVGAFVVFLPGTRSTGAGTGTGNVKNVSVDGFKIDTTQGSITGGGSAFQLSQTKDLINGSEYSGAGAIENVTLSNGYATVPGSGNNNPTIDFISSGITADGQATTTVENFVTKNVHFDATAGGTSAVYANSTFNYFYVDNFRFQDCEWTPPSISSNSSFINWGNKTPPDSIIVDGLLIDANTSTGSTYAFLSNQYSGGNASVINDLTLDRIKTAPGYQLPSAWLLVDGVLNNFRSRGDYIVGPSGGSDGQGIQLNASTAQIVKGVISDGYFNGVKEGIEIDNGVTSGNAVTMTWENDQISNMTHPIFVNGAFNADITYIGGSVNTGANLARISAGSAKLSYSDTPSSGGGASTVTLVSGATVEMRKTDRIAFSPSVVQTPANNDAVNFSATPSYAGVNVVSGSGAGTYIYRGTGTTGWLKLN